MKNTGYRNTIDHRNMRTKYNQKINKNLYETDKVNDDVFKLDLRDMPLSIHSKEISAKKPQNNNQNLFSHRGDQSPSINDL